MFIIHPLINSIAFESDTMLINQQSIKIISDVNLPLLLVRYPTNARLHPLILMILKVMSLFDSNTPTKSGQLKGGQTHF